MYRQIRNVKATDNHELILGFDNEEKRIFDAKDILSYGRFSELEDISAFKRVHISFDTVEWENGLDLDPEYLYEKSSTMQ